MLNFSNSLEFIVPKGAGGLTFPNVMKSTTELREEHCRNIAISLGLTEGPPHNSCDGGSL